MMQDRLIGFFDIQEVESAVSGLPMEDANALRWYCGEPNVQGHIAMLKIRHAIRGIERGCGNGDILEVFRWTVRDDSPEGFTRYPLKIDTFFPGSISRLFEVQLSIADKIARNIPKEIPALLTDLVTGGII